MGGGADCQVIIWLPRAWQRSMSGGKLGKRQESQKAKTFPQDFPILRFLLQLCYITSCSPRLSHAVCIREGAENQSFQLTNMQRNKATQYDRIPKRLLPRRQHITIDHGLKRPANTQAAIKLRGLGFANARQDLAALGILGAPKYMCYPCLCNLEA